MKTKGVARRGKMNVVDVLILLFVFSIALILAYMMFFSDMNLLDQFSAEDNTKTVSYTLEIAPVDDDVLSTEGRLPIKNKDVVYHTSKEFSLGEVIFVSEKMPYMVSNDQKTEMVPLDKMSTFTLKVKAEAVRVGGVYYVNDHVIRIGDEFAFTTPYFEGVCKCIAVEEVTDGE